ncbi:MAG: ABC transporter permease subunit [Candidatus Hodarchaeales archaeon]|jgi:ABC-type Na+ efflux pump permease subunit
MGSIKQIMSLVKQELQSARRTRYIFFSFVIMPLFMWVIQGGVQVLMGTVIMSSQQGETVYFVSYDTEVTIGNETINRGEDLLQRLIASTEGNNSLLYGATINFTLYKDWDYPELIDRINNSQTAAATTPMIIIPTNFTQDYLAYNATDLLSVPPKLEFYTLPGGLLGSSLLISGVQTILYQPPDPFIYHVPTNQDKNIWISTTNIVFKGEEGAATGMGAGFVGFLSVLIAVMAPAPFVSTSFAGEREKKTMESLLALPISRFNILFSKVLAGLSLIGIFAVMNLVGLFGFSLLMSSAADSAGNGFSTASMFSIEASLNLVVLITITMFLSAMVSIGIGISIASLTKDVRSAESLYSMLMMIPAMAVGLTSMFGSLPEQSFGGAGIVLYIIPWAHAIAILNKGLYPQTFASSSITGNIPLDIIFHVSYLVIFILICLYIASRVFEREGILT